MGELTPSDRVFAAVVPPPPIVAVLDEWLSPMPIPGRRVAPRDWHITLRYVGEIEQVAYERWCAELDAHDGSTIGLRLVAVGAVPRPTRATVVWLEVESTEISHLASCVDDAAVSVGVRIEERPYRPHLTLARVRPPADVVDLVGISTPSGLSWTANAFHLMSRRNGHYERLETFRLQ